MIALPRFDINVLEQTHSLLQADLAFSDAEKWITGEIGLFLDGVNALNHSQLAKDIQSLSRGGINDTFERGLNDWAKTLNQFDEDQNNTLTLSLGIETDYEDTRQQRIRLLVEADSYAYDIKPFEYLSMKDRNVLVKCIAEIRAIFLYCPNVTDMADFAGYRLEIFEEFAEWLPDDIKAKGIEAIRDYYEAHQDDFEMLDFYDPDELMFDYEEFITPLPKWVEELNNGKGNEDPFKALSRLKALRSKTKHPEIIGLLNDTIESITDFLRHFPDLKSWVDFQFASSVLHAGMETDNPEIELAYMMSWGTTGFWWSIQSDIFNSMMEAGETASFYAWADAENADAAKKCAERIYRGAALLTKMTEIAHNIEQNLPKSKAMDNRG